MRRSSDLQAGRKRLSSETELRVFVETASADPVAALGFGPKCRGGVARTTADWMQELRAGE